MAAHGRTSASSSHSENKISEKIFSGICRLGAPSEGDGGEHHCGRIDAHIQCKRNARVEPAVGGIGDDGLSDLDERRRGHTLDNGGFEVSSSRPGRDAVSTESQAQRHKRVYWALMSIPFQALVSDGNGGIKKRRC